MITRATFSPWVQIIIGPHLPGEPSITTASNSSRNRGGIESLFQDYQNQLFTTRTATLAAVEGSTADATRSAVHRAEQQAANVSQRNGIKKSSYGTASDTLQQLRSDLLEIGAQADKEINSIIQSNKPLPQTVAEVIAAIEKYSAYAAHKAIGSGGSMINAIQEVLTAQGDGRSAEEFAAENGITLNKPGPISHENIKSYVEKALKEPAQSPALTGNSNGSSTSESISMASTENMPTTSEVQPVGGAAASGAYPSDLYPASVSKQPSVSGQGTGVALSAGSSPDLPAGPSTPATPSTISNITPGIPDSAVPTTAVPTTSASLAPSAPAFSAPDLGPQQLADSFTRGIEVGAPMSQGTGALTQNVMDTAFRPSTGTPDFAMPSGGTDFSPATTPSSGFAVAEAAQHSGASTGYAAHNTMAPAPTMYAAPMAPMATMAPAAPVMSPGPLPAYGADLRPAAMAAPVVPSAPPPLASAPASAPTSAAGANALHQQGPVVRQTPGPVAAATPPVGLTETAAAAATSGAVTGALSAEAAARSRLQNLLEAVARQEPKLRWAIGERDDGSTVLATDLAGGWIPPHVEIPTGVELLTPAPRRNSLEAMLADAALIETWSPGQFLPDAKDVPPTPMSLRARDLPEVDDINWELTQATNWRDGLPRLAHTLAKAGVAGTGVLDTEADLLDEHLGATAAAVLKTYPEADTNAVGNWQLLAAIDALIAQRPTTLNYHFAWFQALHMAPNGDR